MYRSLVEKYPFQFRFPASGIDFFLFLLVCEEKTLANLFTLKQNVTGFLHGKSYVLSKSGF